MTNTGVKTKSLPYIGKLNSTILRKQAQWRLETAQRALEDVQYYNDVANALDDLKIVADKVDKKYGPNHKLKMSKNE